MMTFLCKCKTFRRNNYPISPYLKTAFLYNKRAEEFLELLSLFHARFFLDDPQTVAVKQKKHTHTLIDTKNINELLFIILYVRIPCFHGRKIK